MDNFIDKLAQKFNAQEMIKANSQAEAAEMKKLQLQISEYEKILQEMRKLNYRNSELSEKIDGLVGDNAGKLKEMQEDEQKLLSVLKNIADEYTKLQNEAYEKEEERQAAINEENEKARLDKEMLEELFNHSDEFTHRENVKVYRNVQAVVIDELKKQTEALVHENERLKSKINVVTIVSVISLLVGVAGIVIQFLLSWGINFVY